jgi:hypothetical protein
MRRNSFGSVPSAVCNGVAIGVFSLMIAASCGAQAIAEQQSTDVLVSNNLDSLTTPVLVIADQPLTSDAESTSAAIPASPQVGLPPEDSGWHFAVSPYLWFPGVHGTIGALGREVSVHATPGDLLSNFRFGLMGAFEARYKRIVLPLDLMWIRLEDDKALPFPNLMATKAKLTGSELLLTPKIGYRLLNEERIKIDALTGFRYWHFSENLKFVPSNLNLNFSNSQNLVDPLVGGRVQLGLTPKIVANILGDVGGWGTGSQLEYQVAGVLGYKIKPKWTLEAGYRYLSIDYRNNNRGGTVVYLITSGVIFGATIELK